MRRTLTLILIPLLVLVFAFGLSACSQGTEETSATADLDDDGPGAGPPSSDDDDDSGDDDSGGDDDSSSSDNIVIHRPSMDEVIVGRDVPVQIEFTGNPNTPSLTLDTYGVDITDISNWSWEPPMLFGTIHGVSPGEHILTAAAAYGDNLEQESVRFETTLEGYAGRIDLTLSKYIIDPGQAVTASWEVYDIDDNVITDAVDVTLSTDPTNGVSFGGTTVTFDEAGNFWVIAEVTIDDTLVSDSKHIAVGGAVTDVDHVEISCSPTNLQAGETVTCSGVVYDEDDNPLDHAIVYSLHPENAGSVSGNEITITLADQITIAGLAWGTEIFDTVAMFVTPGEAHDVELTLDPTTIQVEETSLATVFVMDRWNNPISEIDEVTLTSNPAAGVDIDGMEITPHVSADIVITAEAIHAGSLVTDQEYLFVTDPYPPLIELISPERGQFITDTNNITVNGTVFDEHGSIESFTINGAPAYYDDMGRFTETVTLETGLNTLIFTAEDNSGNTIHATLSVMFAPTYLQNGHGISKAIGARINQPGLDSVEDLAEQYVQEAIDEQLVGMFPLEIFHESYDLWGVDIFEGQSEVTGLTMDPVNIELTPIDGGIHLAGIVTNIAADAYLYYDLFDKETGQKFGSTEEFTFTVPNATIAADLLISASGGDLVVTLANTQVSISDIEVDIDGTIFGDIFGWLVEELVNAFGINIIEDLLLDTINEIVPPLIRLALMGLDLNFDLDLFGFEYHLTADFGEVAFDSTGGDIWIHAYMWYGDGSWAPGPNVPELPGSLLTDNGAPTFGVNVPGTSNPYGFGVALGDDVLNQFMHAIHRSGLLSLDLDEDTLELFGITGFELTTAEFGLFFPGLWAEYGMTETVLIKMRPLLPPVFNFNPQKAVGVETEIQLGDFVLEFSTLDESWAKMALAIYLPTTITISEEQTISLEFGELELYSDLFHIKDGIRANSNLFEQFLPNLIEALVPLLLAGVLEDFPIPTLEGFTLNVDSFQKFGPGIDWLGLFGSLVQVPEGKAAYDRQQIELEYKPEQLLHRVP